MKEKIIIVTGISGFLGLALTKSLISQDYTVIGFRRNIRKKLKFNNKKLIIYKNNKKQILKVFSEYSNILGIIHTATCYGRQNETILEILEANVYYPLNLLELAVKKNVKFFINTDTVLQKYLNLYSMSKNQFLDWCRFFAKNSSIKILNLKLQHMYGPGDDSNKFTGFIFDQLIKNVKEIDLTPGYQERDFIFIDDVVNIWFNLFK